MEQDTVFLNTHTQPDYQLKSCCETFSHEVSRICGKLGVFVTMGPLLVYKDGNWGDFEVNYWKPLSIT